MFGGIDIRGSLMCLGHSDSRARIFVVDLADRSIKTSWSFGGAHAFADVGGVCLDRDGHVLVADTCNDRVRRFTLFGKEVGRIGKESPDRPCHAWHDERGYLHRPRDVVVDPAGNLFVACGDRSLVHAVQRFDPSGRMTGSLRSFGEAGESFGAPLGLAVGASRLFVADTFHGCIQVFRLEGRFMGMFSTATQPGERSQPTAVAFLPPDRLAVAQWGSRAAVKCFDLAGNHLGDLAQEGAAPGRVVDPSDLAVDSAGQLLVLDREGERVQRLGAADGAFEEILDLRNLCPSKP